MIPVGVLSSYATTFGLEALYVTKNDLFSGVPKSITIGVESPDRHVIVAIADYSSTVISTPHTLLINGEPALCDVWHYVNQVYVGWYRAAVPTGSTISVDVIGADRIAMQFYTLTGSDTPACVATAKTGTQPLDVVGIEEGPTLIADHNGSRNTSWVNAVLDGTWQGTGTSTHALTVAHLETIGPIAVSTGNTLYKCMASVSYAHWDGNPEYVPNSIWNVSGSSLGAVSDPIPSWGTFSQADTAKQPTVGQSGSFKYAAFESGDVLLQSGNQRLNTDQTMFAVVRVPTAAARTVVGVISGTGVRLALSSTLQASMAAHGGDFAAALSAETATTDTWCVVSGRFKTAVSLESRLNANSISSVNTTTVTTQDRYNQLNGNGGGAGTTPMDIAEAWNFRRALTNSEWDGVVSYLMTKYGIGA